jgi:threonine dehydrogenase-like Zn-dependent dehydrogenase
MTDNTRADALRYGSTPLEVPPGIWGGYSRHQYLHPSSVLHVVPDNVTSAQATFGIPLSNGIQWAQLDGGVRAGDSVVIMGPGQQGAACLLACREAGAAQIVVTGRGHDVERLSLSTKLGATRTIDVDREDVRDVVRDELPGGVADLVIDVSGGGVATFMTGIAVVRVGGTLVVASGAKKAVGDGALLDLAPLRKKRITIRGVRGHGFAAVEQALGMMSRGTPGLDLLVGTPWALDDIGRALAAADAGTGAGEALHVVVDPWRASSEPPDSATALQTGNGEGT